jgi:hypothetical protein
MSKHAQTTQTRLPSSLPALDALNDIKPDLLSLVVVLAEDLNKPITECLNAALTRWIEGMTGEPICDLLAAWYPEERPDHSKLQLV